MKQEAKKKLGLKKMLIAGLDRTFNNEELKDRGFRGIASSPTTFFPLTINLNKKIN